MPFAVDGKLAFITGSAGGLGKEFAKRILDEGGRVCISDVNIETGRGTLEEFAERYGQDRVHFVRCDVTDSTSIDEAFRSALEHFGADRLDILVNNAGVMGEREGWRLCMDINLQGVLSGSVLAMERYLTANGVIVNIASILGLFNAKQPKGWAYNVSKSGVVSFVRCVASNYAGIRVLCLCPSVAQTPILAGCTPQELQEMKKNVGGFMSPQQVGDAFMSLLRDGSSGAVMAVWKDCPPYYIPDMAFPIFVYFTTVAMIFRFVPGFGRGGSRALDARHAVVGGLGIVVTWLLFAIFIKATLLS